MNRIMTAILVISTSTICQAQFSELWHQTYDDPTQHGYDGAFAVAVDKRGNTYITGQTTRAIFATDYITVKYSPAGSELWHQFYNGGGSDGADIAQAIAVDNDGNVYVTGESQIGGNGNPPSRSGFPTAKYDTNRNPIWTRRLDTLNRKDQAVYIAFQLLLYSARECSARR